jgi:UDP-N-acetylmuramoylalanine--D-glutamate ligase
MGLDMDKTAKTVKNFKPAAHRIEFVAEVAGKKFYDDSKGTNIDAVIKAVDTFNEDLALILGGREKNTDFTQLYGELPEYVKKIIVFGENKEKLKSIFEKGYEVITANTMEEVVEKAAALSGVKVVLLSPGCASFDMYKSYAQRGDEFKKYVLKAMKNEK